MSGYVQISSGGQHTRLIRLLRLTNGFPERMVLLAKFGSPGTDSIKKLTSPEAEAMIAYLEERNDSMNRQRRKILAFCHQMNWRVEGTTRVDMARLDQFCVSRGRYKKPLQQHTITELNGLVSQFLQIFSKEIKAY